MISPSSDVGQVVAVVLIGFSLGFLGRRFVALLRFVAGWISATNLYYVLECAMVFALLTLAGWTLVEIEGWPAPALAGGAILAGLVAGANTYYRLLRETGCPRCKTPRPFVRQEMQRRKIRNEEKKEVFSNYRRPYLSLQKPHFLRERSWDLRTAAVYHFYKVRYRCTGCRHEWEVEVARLVSSREEAQELPPETYRPGRRRP